MPLTCDEIWQCFAFTIRQKLGQDIYQVSPWDQLAWDLGQDLGDEPVSQPRLFKSHLRCSEEDFSCRENQSEMFAYLCDLMRTVWSLSALRMKTSAEQELVRTKAKLYARFSIPA